MNTVQMHERDCVTECTPNLGPELKVWKTNFRDTTLFYGDKTLKLILKILNNVVSGLCSQTMRDQMWAFRKEKQPGT